MRRNFIWLGLAVLALGACGEAADSTPAESDGDVPAVPVADIEETPELLFLGQGTGVKVFDPATETVTLDAAPAVPSQQGNKVYRAIPRGDGTEVAAYDPVSGDATWTVQLPEPMELRVAAQDGSAAVLGPVRPDDGSLPGRDSTRLTIVRGPEDTATFDVAGNIEPETFSTDTSMMFVIEYLPATAPESYTVRTLDLLTGELGDVTDRWGNDRQPMRGTARKHVYSPDGTRLYTYYQIDGEPYQGKTTAFNAFVHVLDLKEGWAYCAELPQPFGTVGSVPALAVTPDGDTMYVADATLGQIVEIDTDSLEVARTKEYVTPMMHGAAAIAATDDTLFVATDGELTSFDRASLSEVSSVRAGDWAGALYVSRDTSKIYAALADRVKVFATANLEWLNDLVVGTQAVAYFDPSNVPLGATDDVIKCAC